MKLDLIATIWSLSFRVTASAVATDKEVAPMFVT